MEESYFDGSLLQLKGWRILGKLVTFFTFGICYPWAVCMIYSWETKHTVINGRRLHFNGTAMQLFGSWIKWWFLTAITLGIYGWWAQINLKRWITKHSEFADSIEPVVCRAEDEEIAAVASPEPDTVRAVSGAVDAVRKEEHVDIGNGAIYAMATVGVLLCAAGAIVMYLISWWGLALALVGIGVLLAAERI